MYIGIEAGQAAFGDVFRWFENILRWPMSVLGVDAPNGKILTLLNNACMDKPLPSVFAVDWFNGRRYPYDNDEVKAGLVNLDLGVDAPSLYQALVIAVVFGAKRMFDGFIESGIDIDEVICAGGVAVKSPYVMQTLANVFDRDVGVSDEDEACAKGAAMYAAVGSGAQKDIFAAQAALGKGISRKYIPNGELRQHYDKLFAGYMKTGDFVEKLIGD